MNIFQQVFVSANPETASLVHAQPAPLKVDPPPPPPQKKTPKVAITPSKSARTVRMMKLEEPQQSPKRGIPVKRTPTPEKKETNTKAKPKSNPLEERVEELERENKELKEKVESLHKTILELNTEYEARIRDREAFWQFRLEELRASTES